MLELAIFLRILSNPIANAFQKKLSEKHSSLLVNFYCYLVMSIFCFYPACKIGWHNFPVEFWLYVIISGFLCSISTICLIKALNLGELSILGPINSYKCIVGLVFAFILLGEIPSIKALCGLIFIVLGSRIIFETTKEGFTWKLLMRRDIQLRLLALILSGIEAVFLKKIIILSSATISFILWVFSVCIITGIFVLFSHKKKVKLNLLEWKEIVLIAVCLSVMQFCTNFVFSKMSVGLSLALFQLSSIVALFLGYKLFREKNILRKFLGIIIMIIGAGLILI